MEMYKVYNVKFDTCMDCEMITIKLMNMSITSNSFYHVCVLRTLMIYSQSEFQVYSTKLLTLGTGQFIGIFALVKEALRKTLFS